MNYTMETPAKEGVITDDDLLDLHGLASDLATNVPSVTVLFLSTCGQDVQVCLFSVPTSQEVADIVARIDVFAQTIPNEYN